MNIEGISLSEEPYNPNVINDLVLQGWEIEASDISEDALDDVLSTLDPSLPIQTFRTEQNTFTLLVQKPKEESEQITDEENTPETVMGPIHDRFENLQKSFPS